MVDFALILLVAIANGCHVNTGGLSDFDK